MPPANRRRQSQRTVERRSRAPTSVSERGGRRERQVFRQRASICVADSSDGESMAMMLGGRSEAFPSGWQIASMSAPFGRRTASTSAPYQVGKPLPWAAVIA